MLCAVSSVPCTVMYCTVLYYGLILRLGILCAAPCLPSPLPTLARSLSCLVNCLSRAPAAWAALSKESTLSGCRTAPVTALSPRQCAATGRPRPRGSALRLDGPAAGNAASRAHGANGAALRASIRTSTSTPGGAKGNA